MDIQELLTIYASHSGISALNGLIQGKKDRNIALRGLNGSAAAMVVASLFNKQSGNFVCLLNDMEQAGYFYNDLKQLTGNDAIYFFPSAYRRDIKYGHTDPANEILRTETLSMLQDKTGRFVIVTYPEALAEKVVTQETLKENTLQIHVGERLDNQFVADVLDSYGFERVDYVYEPGQYAIRGSILDVFSYSFEYPYRIDFFGDEVETIRAFDVESQLSKEKLDTIYIVSEVTKKSAATGNCLLAALPDDVLLAVQDLAWCRERIGALWTEEPVVADEESFADASAMQAKLVRWDDFMEQALRLVGMSDFARKTMDRMSDGECQRVMIARALAQDTPLILLDEPTAFLDLPNRYALATLLRRLAHDEHKCILFSTHDLDIALSLCDSVALIDTPTLYTLPADEMAESGLLERLFSGEEARFDPATRSVRLR